MYKGLYKFKRTEGLAIDPFVVSEEISEEKGYILHEWEL